MEQHVALTEDAQCSLAHGAELCRQARLAIFTPEHLLAGAVLALREAGLVALPEPAAIANALELIHGTGEDVPPDDVTFGPGARAVLDAVARVAIEEGRAGVGARDLAVGVVLSGEAAPMFVTAMGASRDTLLLALGALPERG